MELYNKLSTLFREDQTFWRNEHYAVSYFGVQKDDEVKIVYSIFLGHHLPISEVTVLIIGGEVVEEVISVHKPISEEEIRLKILML